MLRKRIRPELTDELREVGPQAYLDFFDDGYFEGASAGRVVGYHDYADCRPILRVWSEMLEKLVRPSSILDVGAAYGFVVEYFRERGLRADGVEPSDFARARAGVSLMEGHLPDRLPEVATPYDVVTCTEVIEHVSPECATDAFRALIRRAERCVVCLIEMGPWDAYHEDPSHIHLRPREWWMERVAELDGAELDPELVEALDAHPMSRRMRWKGRFVVLRPVDSRARLDRGRGSGRARGG